MSGGHHHDDSSVTSTIDKSMRGMTIQADVPAPSRVQVRFRRITPLPVFTDGQQFMDDVIIRDCYGIASVTASDFGDVTCVQTRIQATSQSTAVKERKLQCVVTRKVLQKHDDGTFGPELTPSQNAADIICHIALDPKLGGRTLAELDVSQIYGTVDAVADYFGFPEAAQFNYTFDDDNTSFEEMVQMVAQSIFCNAYRQGSIMKLFFEQPTDDSTMLFTHRNKLPGSETRTVRFGVQDDHDGIEFDWRTMEGEQKTIFIPPDQSAVKPTKIERAGVTNLRQAYVHANRIWNRMRYQNTTTEFDATAEASQLILNERVEITDNTRPDVFDGHVVGQVGLVLELSQPFTAEVGVDYSIFLQLPGGGLDVIPVVAGSDDYHVVLQSATSEVLSYDPENWADVVYQIVGGTPARPSAFLVSEKGAYDKQSVKVQGINYDPRYYQNDHDLPPGPPVLEARGWRIVVLGNNSDTQYVTVNAAEFRSTPGGAPELGGTAFQGGPGADAGNGVDAPWDTNLGTDWSRTISGGYGFYFGRLYDVDTHIAEVALRAHGFRAPTRFKLQYSYDTTNGTDGVWHDSWTGWEPCWDTINNQNEWRVHPQSFTGGKFKVFRFLVLGNNGDTYAAVEQAQLLTGSSDFSYPLTAWGTPTGINAEPFALWDDNLGGIRWLWNTSELSSDCYSANPIPLPHAKPDTYTLTITGDGPNRAWSSWKLQASVDGVTWVDLDSRSGISWAGTNPETKTFTVA